MQIMIILGWVVFTLAVYTVFRKLYLKYTHPLLNVVVLSAAVVITALVLLDLPYTAYAPAKDVMTFFLGPATVGLAFPLYRYRLLLRSQAPSIIASVVCGSFVAMLSAAFIARVGGLPEEIVMSILPKGVSIPFAVEVARAHNGVPALAVAFVVATGTLGGLLGAVSLNFFRIKDPLARGLALGTVSHAQGVGVALEEGEMQGAMAGLAMILAGILTAACSPFAVWLLNLATT